MENLARIGRKFELDQIQANSTIQVEPPQAKWDQTIPYSIEVVNFARVGLSWEDRLARALRYRRMISQHLRGSYSHLTCRVADFDFTAPTLLLASHVYCPACDRLTGMISSLLVTSFPILVIFSVIRPLDWRVAPFFSQKMSGGGRPCATQRSFAYPPSPISAVFAGSPVNCGRSVSKRIEKDRERSAQFQKSKPTVSSRPSGQPQPSTGPTFSPLAIHEVV